MTTKPTVTMSAASEATLVVSLVPTIVMYVHGSLRLEILLDRWPSPVRGPVSKMVILTLCLPSCPSWPTRLGAAPNGSHAAVAGVVLFLLKGGSR